MPIPSVKPDEDEQTYISRCMSAIGDEYSDNDQALAICYSTWSENKDKNMNPHEQMLKAIRARQQKLTRFNRGILTADKYVTTIRDCVGSDACYKFAAKGNVSFDDTLKKASETLTYNNDEMVLQDIYGLKEFKAIDIGGSKIELPEKTLMVFKHVLTTPKKDRDGDILRTEGAVVDPKMPLLWQHVHTLPIGKMLGIAEHNSKRLSLYSVIIDMNELCHDAAVMIDSKMGRYSHSFRALKFDQMKETEGDTTAPGGFDVKEYEIMEESLVSVPANTDAETEEVLLSLVEGGKLTSDLMKKVGNSIREKTPVSSSIKYKESVGDFSREIETSNVADFDKIFSKTTERTKHEDMPGDGNDPPKGKTGCSCGSASKEADGNPKETKVPEAAEIKSYVGYGSIKGSWEYIEDRLNGKCKRFLIGKDTPIGDSSYVWVIATFEKHAIVAVEERWGDDMVYYKCNWKIAGDDPEFEGDPKEVSIETKIEISEKLAEFRKKGHVGDESETSDLCPRCDNKLDITGTCQICGYIADSTDKGQEETEQIVLNTKDAMAVFLAKASKEDRDHMLDCLKAVDAIEEQSKRTEQFKALLGSK